MQLTEEEKLILGMFTADGGGFDIVLKIAKKRLEIEKELAISKIMLTKDATNEETGAQLRAVGEGIRLVEAVFREISQYRKDPPTQESKNPAR